MNQDSLGSYAVSLYLFFLKNSSGYRTFITEKNNENRTLADLVFRPFLLNVYMK